MIEETLSSFFEDFGVVARRADNSEFLVFFDESHSPMEVGAEGRSIVATCPTSEANFDHGDTLEIDGKSYSIVGVRPVDDGKITELDLRYE
ncbi:hypothetical protein V0288_11245 [Pannus brasiliensis CCIBt3594]|uniref:Uncharacterized protein n=1 Tax=Pannus brasiliensis CCIBt3594 TaxID=1427578 RepID=A0AAW9QR44_9CHRO